MHNPGPQEIDRIYSQMPQLLHQLLAAPSAPRASHSPISRKPGIYLFTDPRSRPRYVGQTRNLRTRLRQHTNPKGTHNSATLAFLMARQEAPEHNIPVAGRTRTELQADPAFGSLFELTIRGIAEWPVQFITLQDSIRRTYLEVYVHMALGTDMNSFETH